MTQYPTITIDHSRLVELKSRFKSISPYWQIWYELKQNLIVSISVPEPEDYFQIRKGVSKMKHRDYGYMAFCELIQGYQYTLCFELHPTTKTMTIKLNDEIDKFNPDNLN